MLLVKPFQDYAAVAQLVEHQLPKLRVASSSLVCRSIVKNAGEHFHPVFPRMIFSVGRRLVLLFHFREVYAEVAFGFVDEDALGYPCP